MRRRRYFSPLALILAAAFFANQAFACCYANARFAHSVASLFSPRPAAHACCDKKAAVPETQGQKPPCAKECCLKSETRGAPQLASAPADLPDLLGPAAPLAPAPAFAIGFRPAPALIADTGPPVYLRTLRLLV